MTNSANGSKTILVVEDDIFIRNNLIELLMEEGYAASGAANGQEALNYLQAAAPLPSLILLDLMMPIMNGWQFRTEQEQNSQFKNIPVVVITADGNAEQKAQKMNAEGWVKKPIDIEVLLKVVETHSI